LVPASLIELGYYLNAVVRTRDTFMPATYKVEVVSIGRSLGIVFPDEILAILKVAAGDYVYLTPTPDGGFLLTKHKPKPRKRNRS
jgi:hypothetical protein